MFFYHYDDNGCEEESRLPLRCRLVVPLTYRASIQMVEEWLAWPRQTIEWRNPYIQLIPRQIPQTLGTMLHSFHIFISI